MDIFQLLNKLASLLVFALFWFSLIWEGGLGPGGLCCLFFLFFVLTLVVRSLLYIYIYIYERSDDFQLYLLLCFLFCMFEWLLYPWLNQFGNYVIQFLALLFDVSSVAESSPSSSLCMQIKRGPLILFGCLHEH